VNFWDAVVCPPDDVLLVIDLIHSNRETVFVPSGAKKDEKKEEN
jgi:hypothetical protein